MSSISPRVRAQTILLLAVTLVLSACTEPHREVRTSPRLPASISRSLTAGELSFGCPLRPSIVRRAVPLGTAGDVNGNGAVCDERFGPTGHERVLTTDDVLMPTPRAR